MKTLYKSFLIVIIIQSLYSCQNDSIEKGDVELKKLNYKLAIENYNRYLEIDSLSDDVYYKRSICYMKMEKYKNALYDLNKSILINPKKNEYFQLRGDVNLLMRFYKNALNDYNSCIMLGGNETTINCKKGFIEIELNNYDSAIKYCKQCVSDKDNIDSFGLSYFALSKIYYLYKKNIDSAYYYSIYALKFDSDSTDILIESIRKEYELLKLKNQYNNNIDSLYEEEMRNASPKKL